MRMLHPADLRIEWMPKGSLDRIKSDIDRENEREKLIKRAVACRAVNARYSAAIAILINNQQ